MEYKDLRDLRYKNGDLSQKDMAEIIGISTSTYSLIESGKRHGSYKIWRTIQDVFKLSDADVWKMQNQKVNQ